jgi:hypothetical protein
METFDRWTKRWERLREACATRGMTDRWLEGQRKPARFEIAPPAPLATVEHVEATIGRSLPSAFRGVLLNYSGRLCVQWQRPKSVQIPEEFRKIFAGECRWDLEELPNLIEEYKSWLDNCFTDPTNAYDAVWYGRLPILSVGNGDMVAISLDEPGEPVVYLSHDDGEGHGYQLGHDFVDYVDRLSTLGCPGAEDWQWMTFVNGSRSALLPDSPSGRRWRSWFGLE